MCVFGQFLVVFEFARNEVHLLVCCFLVVPDRARLSRLCRARRRPYSRRVPAGRAVLMFLRGFRGSWQARHIDLLTVPLRHNCVPCCRQVTTGCVPQERVFFGTSRDGEHFRSAPSCPPAWIAPGRGSRALVPCPCGRWTLESSPILS